MNDLIHICTDEKGYETWYEQIEGSLVRCIKIPPRDKALADPELVKAMEEDTPE